MSDQYPEKIEITAAGEWVVSCCYGSIHLIVNRPMTVNTSDIPWQLAGATDKLIFKPCKPPAFNGPPRGAAGTRPRS